MSKPRFTAERFKYRHLYPSRRCGWCGGPLLPKQRTSRRAYGGLETPDEFAIRQTCSPSCGQRLRHQREASPPAQPAQPLDPAFGPRLRPPRKQGMLVPYPEANGTSYAARAYRRIKEAHGREVSLQYLAYSLLRIPLHEAFEVMQGLVAGRHVEVHGNGAPDDKLRYRVPP